MKHIRRNLWQQGIVHLKPFPPTSLGAIVSNFVIELFSGIETELE